MNLLLYFFFTVSAWFHPLHVSLTSMDIRPETGEIKLVHKFFADDLKLLFFHLYEKEFGLNPGSELSATDLQMLDEYLKMRFVVSTGEDTLQWVFEKKEQDEESVWLYFRGVMKPSSGFVVTNLLLLDLFDDQTNLLIISDGIKEKGESFGYRKREATIAWGTD